MVHRAPSPSITVYRACRLRYLLPTDFYQFVRPHHKQQFEDICFQLTGQGCGYQQGHDLPFQEEAQSAADSTSEQGPQARLKLRFEGQFTPEMGIVGIPRLLLGWLY